MLLVSLFAAAALSPGDGKVVAQDDWPFLTISQVGSSPAAGPYYVRVAAGDLDGDGRADEAYLKLVCAGDDLKQAFYQVTSPRDASSGQASGRRQHAPVKFVKEWGPASPQMLAMKPTYDVKKVEGTGARATSDADGWRAVTLGKADGLCPATAAAAQTIVKSKSNISNN
jgi:hypothetical protein